MVSLGNSVTQIFSLSVVSVTDWHVQMGFSLCVRVCSRYQPFLRRHPGHAWFLPRLFLEGLLGGHLPLLSAGEARLFSAVSEHLERKHLKTQLVTAAVNHGVFYLSWWVFFAVHHHQFPGLSSRGQVVRLPLSTVDHCTGLLYRRVLIHLCACVHGLPLAHCQGYIQTGTVTTTLHAKCVFCNAFILLSLDPSPPNPHALLTFVHTLTHLPWQGLPLFTSFPCTVRVYPLLWTHDWRSGSKAQRGDTSQRLVRKNPWQFIVPIHGAKYSHGCRTVPNKAHAFTLDTHSYWHILQRTSRYEDKNDPSSNGVSSLVSEHPAWQT